MVAIAGYDCLSALGHGAKAHAVALRTSPPPPSWVELEGDERERRRLPYRTIDGPASAQGQSESTIELAHRALSQARLPDAERRAAAVLLGSASSTLPAAELLWAEYHERTDFIPVDHPHGHSELADTLAARLGLRGPRFTFGTACSSSANALLYGAKLVANGRVPAALVVGVDWQSRLTLRGFDALMLLDPDLARPFDLNRRGLLLGEGVAALVLTPTAASASPWSLRGGASIGDIDNPTQSSAQQIAHVVSQALIDAGVDSAALAAIKAHGTATPHNDWAEGQALAERFGPDHPPISSVKSALGHTLGACGALETAAIMACLDAGFWPANHGCETVDPTCGIQPCAAPQRRTDGLFLLNFFGFGGNNCAFVVERNSGA